MEKKNTAKKKPAKNKKAKAKVGTNAKKQLKSKVKAKQVQQKNVSGKMSATPIKSKLSRVPRVLVAKPGLDGHDRGAKVVARGLRDQGFEVIYTGLHQTPSMVVEAAIQEDVDIVGLSILSGAHIGLVKAILDLMKKEKVMKPVFVGGIIPEDDSKELKKMGVKAVFGPGSTIPEIALQIHKIIG